MCASVFLVVQQAFIKVQHKGLLYKLKSKLPDQLDRVLESYLEEQYFQVKIDDTLSDCHLTKAGVPHRSVIRPSLYLI
jgi:hypothetical protein